MNVEKQNTLEKLLWSIALPGFGQLLNGKLLKGILFITLEFLVNVQSNFNEAIVLSFHGDIQSAINCTNYQWLMFYPCLYMFAMWDAFKDAGGGKTPFSFVPFVISAFFVTVGLIYSPTFTFRGILFGPIWLPIIFLFIGLTIGSLIRILLIKKMK